MVDVIFKGVVDLLKPLLSRLESLESKSLEKGDKGDKGDPGERGNDGANGRDGKDGRDGLDGAAGRDGIDGKDGLHGKDGDPGMPGKDGADGKDGLTGKDGADGSAGNHGRDGADGKDGVDGLPGKDGVDGKDGIGKDGADGKDGRDGSAGTDGVDGKSVTIEEVQAWLHPLVKSMLTEYKLELEREIRGVVHSALEKAVAEFPRPKDGEDGVSFDTLEYDGDRALRFTSNSGKVLGIKMPIPLYKGVWQAGEYERADTVTFGGNQWIAKCDTTKKPGDNTDDWQMVVRKGRDAPLARK